MLSHSFVVSVAPYSPSLPQTTTDPSSHCHGPSLPSLPFRPASHYARRGADTADCMPTIPRSDGVMYECHQRVNIITLRLIITNPIQYYKACFYYVALTNPSALISVVKKHFLFTAVKVARQIPCSSILVVG